MNLSEFIKKRLAELGKTKSWLVNYGDMDWSTLSNIDKGLSIRKVTQEKLAKALECSQGDIQECMAEQNPLKNVIVNKKSLAKLKKPEADTVQMVMEEKPYVVPAPDPEDEEPAEVFETDEPEEEAEEMAFPVYHSVYEEDRQEGEELYKQKLRDMCLRIFASGIPGVHTMEKIYADIGYAIVKELAQGGDNE